PRSSRNCLGTVSWPFSPILVVVMYSRGGLRVDMTGRKILPQNPTVSKHEGWTRTDAPVHARQSSQAVGVGGRLQLGPGPEPGPEGGGTGAIGGIPEGLAGLDSGISSPGRRSVGALAGRSSCFLATVGAPT